MQITYELIKSLRQERSGIFNWLLDGYKMVREQGGFSFDMDKMKAKERRLFKRKIATVTEVLRKIFGDEEFQQLEEKGLIETMPEKLYRTQSLFWERKVEEMRKQPGSVMGWLEEGNREVQKKGGATYLASRLASMNAEDREEFMQDFSKLYGLLQKDLSQTPTERQETMRKIKEINMLLQQELQKKNQN